VTNILCIFRTRTKSTISKIYIEIQERWDNMSGLYNSYQHPLAPGRDTKIETSHWHCGEGGNTKFFFFFH
jgi:hypothetical protein